MEKCHVEFSYPRTGDVFPFFYLCVFQEYFKNFPQRDFPFHSTCIPVHLILHKYVELYTLILHSSYVPWHILKN